MALGDTLDERDSFGLREVREMVEDLFGYVEPFGANWQPTEPELARISKRLNQTIGTNKELRTWLKQYLSPLLLGGALAAYAIPRARGVDMHVGESPRPQVSRNTVARYEEATAPPAPVAVAPVPAEAPAFHPGAPINAGQPPPQVVRQTKPPIMNADTAQSLMDQAQSTVPR